MRPPRVPEQTIPVIPEQDLKKLLATCEKGRGFEDVRDYAILRMFISTGPRRAEVANMKLEDVDVGAGEVLLHGMARGEAQSHRPSGDTKRAIDRYLRCRARHPAVYLDALWISKQSTKFKHRGIGQMVKRISDSLREWLSPLR